LAAAFFATFADFLDVFLAIVHSSHFLNHRGTETQRLNQGKDTGW